MPLPKPPLPTLGSNRWGAKVNNWINNLDGRLDDLEAAGRPTWLNGTGVPASSLGSTGDWYLNDSNGDLYSKTNAVTWTLKANIIGPSGSGGSGGTGVTTVDNGDGTFTASSSTTGLVDNGDGTYTIGA
jgi:hypothetical protein